MNDIATLQILNNISEKKVSKLSDTNLKKKDISNEKNICIAAVRYNTIGNAYKDRMNNVEVYLVKEEKNGNQKTHAYSRCSKTTQEGTQFCHLHCRMTKYNNDGLKIFDKDIIPSHPNDKSRWLANINDDFFDNMGKRGAKKKNGENNYTFSDENHPVLLILTHKNAKLATTLTNYASQLLKNSNYVCKDLEINDNTFVKEKSKKTPVKKQEDTYQNIGNLMSMISEIGKSSSEKESNNKHIDVIEDDSEEEYDDESDNDNKSSVKSESCNNSDDDAESEGVSCIPIYTNKNKLLWYNEDTKIVYEPEGDDGGEELGVLTKISNEYHTINYNNELYTVLKKHEVKDKGSIFCCVLTDTLFDKKMNFIGSRTKLKNNEYRFDFI
jgi:hypothetical protein